MKWVIILDGFLAAPSAFACDAFVAQASLGIVLSNQQPLVPALDAGLSCGLTRSETKPLVGAHGRLAVQRDWRLIGQLGMAAGVLMPRAIAVQAELGLIGDNGVVRPTFGGAGWAAPGGLVSPRVGAAWTHFLRDGAGQDWFFLSAGVAANGSLSPTNIPLTHK